MPEAAIGINDNFFLRKNEIRIAEKRVITSPTGNFLRFKIFDESELGAFVPRGFNCPHDCRALLLGENVRHEKSLYHTDVLPTIAFWFYGIFKSVFTLALIFS